MQFFILELSQEEEFVAKLLNMRKRGMRASYLHSVILFLQLRLQSMQSSQWR